MDDSCMVWLYILFRSPYCHLAQVFVVTEFNVRVLLQESEKSSNLKCNFNFLVLKNTSACEQLVLMVSSAHERPSALSLTIYNIPFTILNFQLINFLTCSENMKT